ncbi:glycoside hydrolase family 88 protein [Paenibacillus lautus]|uniref:glycoside hydrolase family 88 protein n=1 Tax=Paenibacillus lautus TaxID=1401 RepID=UPI002DB6F40E|nr:glycoside hydrolase family 88 protein [Paenibacillus lautus]MEC0257063.1 glycoside hydrolase family 88 protein [Paenibacillus lautus]
MEAIQEPLKYGEVTTWTQQRTEAAIEFVLHRIDQNLDMFSNRFPSPASRNNIYETIGNTEWTSSFWTGMLWLAYEVTGDAKYRSTAELQLHSYKERVEKRIATETHDLGFLYSLSCVAAYKLTGNTEARRIALAAADLLMERHFQKAGIIQAWGKLDQPSQRGRMIIDCCMNLPLLYWATEETRKPEYRRAAISHAQQSARYLIREDSSTYHTYYMDVESGEPRFGQTSQGYSDHSCWSRGQAWAIYGLPLSYAYMKEESLLHDAERVTNYFLNRLPEDYVCYWDLIFTEGLEERDSSAAAISVCGMLELAKHLPLSHPRRRTYENAALRVLGALSDRYTTVSLPGSNGILQHAVYGKPLGNGIDECCIWGDYFYFEALVRVYKDWDMYW